MDEEPDTVPLCVHYKHFVQRVLKNHSKL